MKIYEPSCKRPPFKALYEQTRDFEVNDPIGLSQA